MTTPNVHAVIASAGTGKTYDTVERIVDAIKNGIAPETIVATTFTRSAAAELAERTRARLTEDGRQDEAARLVGARFGTVNAICGDIVAHFALELGRSPRTQVVAEELQPFLLAIAADGAFGRHASELSRLERFFGPPNPKPFDRTRTWREDVQAIVDKARANGLDADGIRRSGELSKAGFRELMPEVASADADGEALDRGLEAALANFVAVADGTKIDRKEVRAYAADVRRHLADLRAGRPLQWGVWAKLAASKDMEKASPAKYGGLVTAADDVKRAASACWHDPRVLADAEAYIGHVFACAAEALDDFQRFKAERGLLDFVDQETQALAILRDPTLREPLKEQIRAVFVDEFQDSSPLQLAIVEELARIAERSVWVGDPKQSIFGFRATDARLTRAFALEAARRGGTATTTLDTSRRQRPSLAAFVNDLFREPFQSQDLTPEEITYADTARSEGVNVPRLHAWHLETPARSSSPKPAAVATALRQLLAAPERWQVEMRGESAERAPAPGDIAVLARTGSNVGDIARALDEHGFHVAAQRTRLTEQPECQLAIMALRWLGDRDELALATLVRLARADDPNAWLDALADEDRVTALVDALPFGADLEALRPSLATATPLETLDAVATLPTFRAVLAGWPGFTQRLENLEALRGLVAEFEKTGGRYGLVPTLAGLLMALTDARIEEAPIPVSLDGDAVHVLTYHKAKGREWPVVVMLGLEKDYPPRFFEPTAESESPAHIDDPLAGRWIRLWPHPYGRIDQASPFMQQINTSESGRRIQRADEEEALRLLYVGCTRARDHLVLAAATAEPPWLRCLHPEPLVLPFGAETSDHVIVGGGRHPIDVCTVSEMEPPVADAETPVHLALPQTATYSRRWVRPSATATSGDRRARSIALGERLPLAGAVDMNVLGSAFHAAVAGDTPALPREIRYGRFARTFETFAVNALDVDAALTAADRLYSHLFERFPGARLVREYPVVARLDGDNVDRFVDGRVDLAVFVENGFAVIDHKTFPGPASEWHARAIGYAGQLEVYARALELALHRPCLGLFVHLPVVGQLVEIQAPDD